MGYNRLTSPASTTSSSSIIDSPAYALRPRPATNRKKCLAITFALAAVVLLLASALSAAVLVTRRSTASGAGADHPIHRRPTSAIDRTCSRATYPKLCVNSLINFPGAAAASGERDLVPISINATLQRFHRALYGASAISGQPMHPLARSAYDACVELMETSAAQLSQSLAAVAGKANADDVLTWLSAAATNQDTCGEGLAGVEEPVKLEMEEQLRDLGELVSNCLAIFAASKEYLGGVPIQDRRRRLMGASSTEKEEVGFPAWVRRGDRRLMMMPTAGLKADYVVSKDGQNCTHTTIEAAIKAVPEYSSRRLIIYIRAGR